jgi:hypothetical protein
MSKINNWKWCAFALLLTVLFGATFIGTIIDNTDLTILERLQASVSIVGLLAFWGLGLQKRIFQKVFWRLFLFVDASILFLCMISGKKHELPVLVCVIVYLVIAAVTIPYYIGMFIYAFRSKQIWGETEHRSSPTYLNYPHLKWVRRKRWLRKRLGSLKWFAIVTVIILCLTFIPLIIRNNRVIYSEGEPPEWHQDMLKYRRTTIPELQEFENLFPNYLCDLDFSESNLVLVMC